jgi:ArsR family transcriptional regulator
MSSSGSSVLDRDTLPGLDPISTGIDALMAHLDDGALHHASHPQTAVNEAFRILKPGGQLLVLDLKEHSFEQARELYGDLWLGFKESALHGFLKLAGFQQVEVTAVSREEQEPHFETLLASGLRAGK